MVSIRVSVLDTNSSKYSYTGGNFNSGTATKVINRSPRTFISDIQVIVLNFPKYWSAIIAAKIALVCISPVKAWKMKVDVSSLKFKLYFKKMARIANEKG